MGIGGQPAADASPRAQALVATPFVGGSSVMVRLWHSSWRSQWPTAARLQSDDSGATAIEYGLIAALVTIAILASLSTLGANLFALPLPALIAAFESAL